MVKVENKSDESVVYLYGPVGDEWGGVTDLAFADALDRADSENPINLRINSEGGSVFAGYSIYNLLVNDSRRVRVSVDGLAASIASIIAMAGDRIEMASESMMMIHEPLGFGAGDFREFERLAGVLRKIRKQLAGVYERRGKLTAEQFLEAMEGETWYEPEEAKEAGLTDGITEESSIIDSSRYVDLGCKYRRMPAAIRSRMMAGVPKKVSPAVAFRLRLLEMDTVLTGID